MKSCRCEEKMLQNLEDAGCAGDTIARFMDCYRQGNTEQGLCLLADERECLLSDIHLLQRQMERLACLAARLSEKKP